MRWRLHIFCVVTVFVLVNNASAENKTHENFKTSVTPKPATSNATIGPSMTTQSYFEALQSCLVPHPRINCTASLSDGAAIDLEIKCISSFPQRALRIVGEYDVLTFNCFSDKNLDFDYNGFQPTEAIKILFWNTIKPRPESMFDMFAPSNLTTKEYHMRIDIYSNKALHKYYTKRVQDRTMTTTFASNSTIGDGNSGNVSNITNESVLPMLMSSRTGQYVIRGMHGDDQKQEFSVYLFLEEPGLEPKLIFNNATKPYEVASNRIVIPCRPSNFNSTVTLYRVADEKLLPVTNGDFNPREGFNIPVESQRDLVIFQVTPTTFGMNTWRFQCSIGTDKLNMSYPGSDSGNLFGFDALPQVPARSPQPPINIEPNPISLDPVSVNITCVIVDPDPVTHSSFLAAIDYENPAEIRLVRECVLPNFYNKCYSVRTAAAKDETTHELKILKAPMVGTYYCGSGATYNKIRSYAVALSGKFYDLDFDTQYAMLQHSSPPPQAHVQLKLFEVVMTPYEVNNQVARNVNVTLIAGREYTFVCRIGTFTMGRTIIWRMKYQNGTERIVRQDYTFEGEFRNYTLTATWDLNQLSCSAAFWNMDLWRTDALKFNIEGEKYFTVASGYALMSLAILVQLN